MINDTIEQYLLESRNYACGIIGASSSASSKADNNTRAKTLAARLIVAGYTVIKISSPYLEDYKKSNSATLIGPSFLAIDRKSKENMLGTLLELAQEFEQRSFLFVPVRFTTAYIYCIDCSYNPTLAYDTEAVRDFRHGQELDIGKLYGKPFFLDGDIEEMQVGDEFLG